MKRIKGKHLLKLLAARGWVLDRVYAIGTRVHVSHHFFVRPGVPATISVPMHADIRHNPTLKPRTLKSILNAAGLTDDDL